MQIPGGSDYLRSGEMPSREIETEDRWQSLLADCPEQYRDAFRPYIEMGRLTPELYQFLSLQIRVADTDQTMENGYNMPHYKRVAEANYLEREIRFFPHAQTLTKEKLAHVLGHEIGHFLGAHFVSPEDYATIVQERPMWSNGSYIQEVGANEAIAGKALHEMLADDLSDYFKSDSAAEMLAARLERSGSAESLQQRSPEEIEALYQEAQILFQYFEAVFDPERLKDMQVLEQAYQSAWLEADGLYTDTFDLVESVPEAVAERHWAPEKPRKQPPKQEFDFFAWLFGWGD